MKIITIDGIDKSGKSTIINELLKATNYNVMVIDRSISSWHFFNVLLDRIDKSYYQKQYNSKLKDYRKIVDLSVILTVNEIDWKIRCETHKEPELVGNLSFVDHQKELVRHFDKAKYSNVLRLNTSDDNIEECVLKILKRI